MELLKKVYIWCKRFRHRRGYGVHSPLAFEFITQVIYEKSAYYAYEKLRARHERLLFRLVNYAQPQLAIEVGDCGAPLFLAKPSARVVEARGDFSLFPTDGMGEIGFAHLPMGVADARKWCELLLPRFGVKSLLVVDGIHADTERRELWQWLLADSRTGISFDLYETGIIMFDLSRIKQSYIVNY